MKVYKAASAPQKPVNMLLYGPPGCGKTTFAATAPGVLIIDFENKAEKTLAETHPSTDLLYPGSDDQIEDLVDYAINKRYQTVAWDTTDRLFDILLFRLLKARRRQRPEIQDWGEVMMMIKRQVIRLQAASIHVILLAHQVEEKDRMPDGSQRVLVRPNIPTKLRAEVPAAVDLVGYMGHPRVVEGQNCIWLKPSAENLNNKWYCKTAWSHLPDFIRPNFSALLRAIYPEPQPGAMPAPSPEADMSSAISAGWSAFCGGLAISSTESADRALIGWLEYKYGKASLSELNPEEQLDLLDSLTGATPVSVKKRQVLSSWMQSAR